MRFIPFARAPGIAGFGVLSPAGRGTGALVSALEADAPRGTEVTVDLASLIGSDLPAFRRADRYGALALAVALEACTSAAVEPPSALSREWGVVVGSSLGCFDSCARFNDGLGGHQATETGPALFSRTVSSAATRDISLALHLGGSSETFVSGWTAGTDALIAAGTVLADTDSRWMLAGAVEAPGERFQPVHLATRQRAGLEWLPESLAEGAACLLLGADESVGRLRLRAFWRGREPDDRWSLDAALRALHPLTIEAVIIANTVPTGLLERWRHEAAGRALMTLPGNVGEIGSAGSIASCAMAGELGYESVLIVARGIDGDIGAVALSR